MEREFNRYFTYGLFLVHVYNSQLFSAVFILGREQEYTCFGAYLDLATSYRQDREPWSLSYEPTDRCAFSNWTHDLVRSVWCSPFDHCKVLHFFFNPCKPCKPDCWEERQAATHGRDHNLCDRVWNHVSCQQTRKPGSRWTHGLHWQTLQLRAAFSRCAWSSNGPMVHVTSKWGTRDAENSAHTLRDSECNVRKRHFEALAHSH